VGLLLSTLEEHIQYVPYTLLLLLNKMNNTESYTQGN